MSPRIFLLRVLLGWWLIPFCWISFWPVGALISGPAIATEVTKDICQTLWHGD